MEYITGAFLDITERKVAERALYESEREYRSLFNSGPNPIFVLDARTLKILDANPSAGETYGYALAELIKRSFLELGEFDRQEVHSALAELPDMLQSCVVSQRCGTSRRAANLLRSRHGIPRTLHGKGSDHPGSTDITEMMEKDAQLIQASKMKTLGEMSAGIAHELNQPLNAIKIGNEYLKLIVEREARSP